MSLNSFNNIQILWSSNSASTIHGEEIIIQGCLHRSTGAFGCVKQKPGRVLNKEKIPLLGIRMCRGPQLVKIQALRSSSVTLKASRCLLYVWHWLWYTQVSHPCSKQGKEEGKARAQCARLCQTPGSFSTQASMCNSLTLQWLQNLSRQKLGRDFKLGTLSSPQPEACFH